MTYYINKQVTELKLHATTMWEWGSGQSNGDRKPHPYPHYPVWDRCCKNGTVMWTDMCGQDGDVTNIVERVEHGDK